MSTTVPFCYSTILMIGAGVSDSPGQSVLHSGQVNQSYCSPIAFHMDRVPKMWSDVKSTHRITAIRQAKCPGYSSVSAVNTAISIRLSNQPDRLFWSGLQTYQDVYMLVKKTRK